MKPVAKKQRETHFVSNGEKKQWIEDYVARETAGLRKGVEDAKTAVQQEQEDKSEAENVGLMNGDPELAFQVMVLAVGEGRSDLASSDNGEDGEDENHEETEQGQQSKDDQRGGVMGTHSNAELQHMDRFRQKQMKHEELTQQGWEDTAYNSRERDKKYGTSKWIVRAAVTPQTDNSVAAPAPTTFGELMKYHDIVPGIS